MYVLAHIISICTDRECDPLLIYESADLPTSHIYTETTPVLRSKQRFEDTSWRCESMILITKQLIRLLQSCEESQTSPRNRNERSGLCRRNTCQRERTRLF